jgi:hypothetical protein
VFLEDNFEKILEKKFNEIKEKTDLTKEDRENKEDEENSCPHCALEFIAKHRKKC